ncbi:hypothetical protein [Rhodococcus sp. JVH1]|uniref:hypothetical protein n=1 Tax=Rhodococcus sp. JVH1 TaxID=745408 RepID=UPI0012F6DF0E|nr:hypothetical protein [Rhodococcus sp. JVH1]
MPVRVHFDDAGPDGYLLTFPYDAEVVGLVKALPKNRRRYSPDTKQWAVHPDVARDLVGALHAHGHTTTGLDSSDGAQQGTQREPRPTPVNVSGDPRIRQAIALLEAVLADDPGF